MPVIPGTSSRHAAGAGHSDVAPLARADERAPAPRRPDRRWHRAAFFGRAAAVLGGLTVPLLLVEILLRQFGAVLPGEYQTADLQMASAVFGRQNIPNRAGWKKSGEYSVHVRVNSGGLRGPELPFEKAAGTTRILVLGDSFTFGAQVEEHETVSVRMGEYLRGSGATDPTDPGFIEIINAGVDGWTTLNQLAWLRSEGLSYTPDLIVLMFYQGNDPGENFDLVRATRRVVAADAEQSGSALRDVRRALRGASTLYALFETGMVEKLTAPPPDAALSDAVTRSRRRSADDDRKDEGWAISATLVRQMRALATEYGAGLLVVGIPTLEFVLDAHRPPRPLQLLADRAGVDHLDLLDPLRAAAAQSAAPLYFPKDRHWTASGHDAAAVQIARHLSETGRLHRQPTVGQSR